MQSDPKKLSFPESIVGTSCVARSCGSAPVRPPSLPLPALRTPNYAQSFAMDTSCDNPWKPPPRGHAHFRPPAIRSTFATKHLARKNPTFGTRLLLLPLKVRTVCTRDSALRCLSLGSSGRWFWISRARVRGKALAPYIHRSWLVFKCSIIHSILLNKSFRVSSKHGLTSAILEDLQ